MTKLNATPVRSERISAMTRLDGSFVGKGPSVSESVAAHDAEVTVNEVADVTVTPPTDTEITPEVAPAGTVTVSCVAVAAVTVAVTPFMVTVLSDGVVLKFVPVIMIEDPVAPLPVKLVIVSSDEDAVTVKFSADVAVLPFTVTAILPVLAPSGTVTVSCVVVAPVTTADIPLNVTELLAAVALKLVPVSVTLLPTAPLDGENPPSVTAGLPSEMTVNSSTDVAEALLTDTDIFPEVAPAGTTTVSCVPIAALTVATVPLNLTILFADVALKLVPVIVTVVPTDPLAGVNAVIAGVRITSSSLHDARRGTIKLEIPRLFKNRCRSINYLGFKYFPLIYLMPKNGFYFMS